MKSRKEMGAKTTPLKTVGRKEHPIREKGRKGDILRSFNDRCARFFSVKEEILFNRTAKGQLPGGRQGEHMSKPNWWEQTAL